MSAVQEWLAPFKLVNFFNLIKLVKTAKASSWINLGLQFQNLHQMWKVVAQAYSLIIQSLARYFTLFNGNFTLCDMQMTNKDSEQKRYLFKIAELFHMIFLNWLVVHTTSHPVKSTCWIEIHSLKMVQYDEYTKKSSVSTFSLREAFKNYLADFAR